MALVLIGLCLHTSSLTTRGGSTLGQGALAPSLIHFLLPSPDSKANWPFWRDFWGLKMIQNPNFPGSIPDPAGELTLLPQTPNL